MRRILRILCVIYSICQLRTGDVGNKAEHMVEDETKHHYGEVGNGPEDVG